MHPHTPGNQGEGKRRKRGSKKKAKAALTVTLSKNPGPEKPQAVTPVETEPKPAGVARFVWSWPSVSFALALLLGGGISFMTSSHALIADGLFLVGMMLFLSKFVTWEETRSRVAVSTGVLASLMLTAGAVTGNHYINRMPVKPIVVAGSVPVPPLPTPKETPKEPKPIPPPKSEPQPHDKKPPLIHIIRYTTSTPYEVGKTLKCECSWTT